jgi:two-component system, cell cycle response regulator
MRILIADDDATSRLMLKAIATKLGHECLLATDGSSAWEILSEGGIDVLLSDWMMPGVDGPELCRRVREELTGSYVYVVLITGLGDHERVLEGMGAGADDYLIKPVDPFAVQTRLVAAERMTILHRQLIDVRAQLELANLELLGRSLTDVLTGLGNRRHMEEDLGHVHAAALRTGRPYGVALFDIDHFKLYNDHYGHVAGDDVLRQVAQSLRATARAGESVYRYGGEEFLLLLPDCTVDGAAMAARRLREAVKDMALPHLARPTPPPVVTLSGGVTCWLADAALPLTELLQQADEALYQAKTAGRDRIVVAAGAAHTIGIPAAH